MSNPRVKVMLAAGILAAAVFAAVILIPLLAPKPECPITSATAQDFEEAVAIGEGIFEPDQWRLETGEHPGIISVGWFEDVHEGLAHSQLLLYNCGYSQADVDGFYGEEGMAVMLGGYDSHTLSAECSEGDLTLREYEVDYDGRPYNVRFWYEPVSETRVRDMHLGFLPEDDALMERYASRLYPQLSSCA